MEAIKDSDMPRKRGRPAKVKVAESIVTAILTDKAEITKTYSDKNVSIKTVDFAGEIVKQFTTVDLLEQYYRFCEIVRACIDAIAYASIQSGYHFESIDPDEEINKNHQIILQRFFDDINEEDEFSDLCLDTFFDMLTFGDGYWEKVVKFSQLQDFLDYIKNPVGDAWEVNIPYKMYKVGTKYMHPYWDKDTKALGKYVQKDITGRDVAEWKPSQIVHFRIPSPIDELLGFAPSTTLKNIIAADIFSNNYNAKFFENNATPRLHIDLGKVSKAELDSFCGEAEANLKGKPHKNLVTRGGVTVTPIGLTNDDMQFAEYQKHLTQKILAIYRVPPIILGMTDMTKGVTAESQIALFKFLAVDPVRRIVASRINKKVIRTMFPGMKIKFAFNPIDRLDVDAQSKVDKTDLEQNIKTINEIRASRGMGKVKHGDKPILMPGQFMPEKSKNDDKNGIKESNGKNGTTEDEE